MKFSLVFVLAMLSIAAFSADKILYQDNYDSNLELPVRVKGANQPYEINFIGIADGGKEGKCLKADVKTMHSFEVCLAPRTKEWPKASWGNPQDGKSGYFHYPSLNIPLDPQKGYVITAWMKLPENAPDTPLYINVELSYDTPSGKNYAKFRLDQSLNGKTAGKWVKFEQELNSSIMEKIYAGGDGTKNLAISAISAGGYIISKQQYVFMADELTVTETSFDRVTAEKKRKEENFPGKQYTFKNIPASENFFAWGAYGSFYGGANRWFRPITQRGVQEHIEAAKKVKYMTPLSLPVMKRHHFNMLITGGGMIFSNQGQEARDYVKTTLDAMHCFNMKFIPSTYVSDYYAKTPWTVVQDKIKQLTSQIKDHPALLAYLLVDEPELDRIEDFFRGKNEMEKNDSGHSAICCANNVDAANIYAKKIPLYIADYYPVSTVPNRDRGVWAIIDNIQHAKSIGAQNIWLAAQLFGGIGGWRTPTLPEFKIMYFGSLAEGATGFIPYGYAQGTLWLNPEKRQYAESGNLIDPFDTPTEHMVWKKEIAPLFRSTGDFFLQAKRMDDSEIVSSNQETFENAVGRIRRKVGAVMRKTANGKAKLVVAWNNHLDGKISSTLTFPNLKNTDQILDCSTLQILSGQKVEIAFAPGDGNIFMIADANTLKEMCSKISEKRAELEIDLLKSEILDAKNLHLNTTDAETDLKKAESFLIISISSLISCFLQST